MKTVLIVQARMTSTRLPGKVLMDLGGRPMLAQQLHRLRACREADELMIATTTNREDDPVVALAEAEGVRWYRGSEHDVLSRYQGAAREAGADVIGRITSDCPLIDPAETDRVLAALKTQACDYASNVMERTFPRGLDTEALHRDVLDRVARLATSTPAREHVTYFIHSERPDLFLRHSVSDTADHSDQRWTVDTPEDLALARKLYEDLDLGRQHRPYREILAHALANPQIMALNAAIRQKET